MKSTIQPAPNQNPAPEQKKNFISAISSVFSKMVERYLPDPLTTQDILSQQFVEGSDAGIGNGTLARGRVNGPS